MSKQKPQLTLFVVPETPPTPDVSKLLYSGRDENITLAYIMLQRSMSKAGALVHIFEKLLFKYTDWIALWDEFEVSGVMTYLSFKIRGVEISCFEMHGDVMFYIGETGFCIFSWGEHDVFDKNTEIKIRDSAIKLLNENKAILNRILP